MFTHIDVQSPDRQRGHGEAARIGTILASEVLKTFRHLHQLRVGPLQVQSEIVRLPTPGLRPGEAEKAREVVERAHRQEADAPAFLELVNAFKVLSVAELGGKPLAAEVQVIALGDALAWVKLPGEVFVELGTAIKTAFPFPYTIVTELANGSIDYIPNRKAFAEGAYEVISARCQPGCGETLVDTAARLLIQLHQPHSDR